MSEIKSRKLTGTTAAGGGLTVDDTLSIVGELVAVEWAIGSFDAGVDAVLSVQTTESGVAQTLLTLTDANANAWYRVRHLVHSEAGAALTGTAGADRAKPIINGTLRLAVTSGGNAKTGGVVVYYE